MKAHRLLWLFVLLLAPAPSLADVPPGGRETLMSRYYTTSSTEVGRFPGRVICVSEEKVVIPGRAEPCAAPGYVYALSMEGGTMIHPLLAGTDQVNRQLHSGRLEGDEVIILGMYYPSNGAIFAGDIIEGAHAVAGSLREPPVGTVAADAPPLRESGTARAADVPPAPPGPYVAEAYASFRNANGDEIGRASLQEGAGGVLIQARLTKLPPGTHAFHIHEVGKCEPPFESAGAHFNPEHSQHGFLNTDGEHAGDLPNIHVPESGEVQVEVIARNLRLAEGPNKVLDEDGAALVVHVGPDDYRTNPAGGAGDRIACAVIRR